MSFKNICALSFVLAILTSCNTDFSPEKAEAELYFTAEICEHAAIKTRFPSEDSTTYITHSAFDCDFYMQLDTETDNKPITEFGIYEVPSTYEGRLDYKASANGSESRALNWKSLRGDHTFFGWTFPSGDYLDYGPNPFADLNSKAFEDAMANGVEINFKNSAEGALYNKYNNNEIYEKFIGTKKGPVSYVKEGTYVPLIFRHLVSKIFVDEIILDRFGSIQEHLKANMTIYGLPTSAIFYPNPSLAENFNEENDFNDGWPVVVPVHSENDEMTFYIENDAKNQDYVWICPEVDFKDLSFSVWLLNTEEGYDDLKEFSGTFKNVVFDRSGMNWDNASGDDSTVLHAGEMMVMRIILYPGGNGGLYIQILPWSTHDPEDTAHYSHTGIYSDTSLNELAEIGDDDDRIDNFFSLYGETEEVDGKEQKVFNLYENSNFTYSTSSDRTTLRVHNNYILEGNGHLITSSKSKIQIRNVRNLFITDGKGNYVYIDSEGKIYKVDPLTFNLIEPSIGQLTNDKSSVIDIAAGTVS